MLAFSLLVLAVLASRPEPALAKGIDRHSIVSRFNPTRNASSTTTPMQVGNGNFAFGADVTGLQTFQPFSIMSSWAWKNDSLPPGKTWADVEKYKGETWDYHGRPLEIMYGGDPLIQQWLISNPNRVNLGRVGLLFLDAHGHVANVSESDLTHKRQKLDLWSGTITSQFTYDGEQVTVSTTSAQSSSAVGVSVHSSLVRSGRLGIFLDFPWNDGKSKFSAPFVGLFNATSNHTTTLTTGSRLGRNVQAEVAHILDASTFITSVGGDDFSISRDSPSVHRYSIKPKSKSSSFGLSVSYSTSRASSLPAPSSIASESSRVWQDYWTNSGFIDVLTGSSDPRANELQRRIILSRYHMRVNEAGENPPQESGLVNNGWYGKFHMEMAFWHMAHWQLWNNWDLASGAGTSYNKFLPTAIQRAQVQQNFSMGARWSKMTDPTGRSAPGEINELLIWQQPHPLIFAEYEYRTTRSRKTLEKWKDVVTETANWMAAFAFFNQSTRHYDLGPPMYVVAENTTPNITRNPAFELAYWKYGLGLAQTWLHRLNLKAPTVWQDVKEHLAPLPIEDGLYAVYEGIETNFWTDPMYINDHPALVGLHGWLPPIPGVDLEIAKATADKAYVTWNITNCWGWDFPMLAMSAARNGETEQAIEWLLHPLFGFDEIGMPLGGVRVPTPYFPGSGALLYAVAMMGRGWDGSHSSAPGFPKKGWNVRVENINPAL